MADKFEDLRNYVAVVDSGGINAAAAALGIAKSAVSRRLSELEQRLGTTLINRSTRRFEPTAVGRHYYDSAKRLLDELAALDAGFSEETSPEPVTLTVAVDRPLAAAVTTALAPVAGTPRGIVVRIVDAASIAEDADLWLGTEPPVSKEFDRLSAGSSTLVVVGSPALLDRTGRPTSTSELNGREGVANSNRSGCGWAFEGDGKRPPRIVMTVPDDYSAASFAIAGAGLARVPLHVVSAAVSAGDLERLLVASECADAIDMWIRSDADVAVRRLADELVAAFKGAIGANQG